MHKMLKVAAVHIGTRAQLQIAITTTPIAGRMTFLPLNQGRLNTATG